MRESLKTKGVNPATKNVNVMKITQIGMLSAVAIVFMFFQIPTPIAPSFYQIDLSEVPVLIGTFALGPVAGVVIEFVKITVNFLLKGSATAGVGEVANFLMGCAFCIPAGLIYQRKKTKKRAMVGLLAGTLSLTVIAGILNAYVLLPAYALAFSIPIDSLVEMGALINKGITNINTFVLFAVVPFNLIKGIIVSIVVLLSYKKIKLGTGML